MLAKIYSYGTIRYIVPSYGSTGFFPFRRPEKGQSPEAFSGVITGSFPKKKRGEFSMKRTNHGASALRRLSVALLAVMLVASLLCSGSAYALDAGDVSRMNVMLVIDGSGSLTMSGGTDVDGNRYHAIDLFLALLTNSGNNVGAIVFNHETRLNAPIAPINGKADKVALSQKVKDAGAGGDTNTGAALLAAVDACNAATAQNGLKSVILLFSDGNINMDYNGGAEAVALSLENQETAINNAQTAQIPIHTICLNDNSYSHPEEMEQISQRTGGSYSSVSSSRDLAVAFENFYKLIFPGASNEISQTTFPADGKLNFDIQIPTYGAEEVNIIVNTTALTGREITAPGGVLDATAIEDNTMTGGPYAVTKLVDPEKGLWNVSLTGTPGTEVTVNVLYNIDSAAQLRTADGKNDYGVNESATFQVNLLQQGNVITDAIVTQEYTAKLVLTNLTTGEETSLDMTPDANGMFVCTYTGTDYHSFTAKAVLSYANLNLYSNELPVNFGNSAPVANTPVLEVKQTVTPISGKSKTVDVAPFFTDAQDSHLTYTIVSSQLIQNTASLDGATGTLTVNTAKSRSGDVVIQATDSQGATAQMIVRFKVTNLTWVIFGTIIAAVVAGLVVLAVTLYIALNKPFKGMIAVTNPADGIRRTHGSFRGKVTLKDMRIANMGIEGGAIVATGGNQVELRAKSELFSGTTTLRNPKRMPLGMGRNIVYSDNTKAHQLIIEVQPSARR